MNNRAPSRTASRACCRSYSLSERATSGGRVARNVPAILPWLAPVLAIACKRAISAFAFTSPLVGSRERACAMIFVASSNRFSNESSMMTRPSRTPSNTLSNSCETSRTTSSPSEAAEPFRVWTRRKMRAASSRRLGPWKRTMRSWSRSTSSFSTISCASAMNWRSASSITAISLAQIQDRPRMFLIGEESGGKVFLCANSVMLCVSVVKFYSKTDSTQRHRGDTKNHRATQCFRDSLIDSLLLRSRFGDHQWIDFHLSAIENPGTLHASFLRIDDLLFALGERNTETEATTLLHLLFLHLRHALGGKVEPLARAHHAILWFVIGGRSLQSLFDQCISEQAVSQLRGFQRGLITLRGGENVHAFFISELRQTF